MSWRDKYPPLFDYKYIYRNFSEEFAEEIMRIVDELAHRKDGVFSSSWPTSEAIINHVFFGYECSGATEVDLVRLYILRKIVFADVLKRKKETCIVDRSQFDICEVLNPLEALRFSFEAFHTFIYCVEWNGDSLASCIQEIPISRGNMKMQNGDDEIPF
ncbi:hypothetical protein DOM22_05305 [Bdellovibrio sp. ZAP7]|uniref:hypothetical protein n=1 Tax=Bdellovibrio sp. ZAP7 TaxID=2231053 RepID=UPI001159823D|nr:hypothetical protein [Bdellovibrio sp. ZAP7]QDK44618.1 hypothetical protein DOM22_05305 [Bdellovibrio sp. ZAP7]